MIFVPRTVKKIQNNSTLDTENNNTLDTAAVELASLKLTPAWVLLGEPGAGKTGAFKTEANLNQDLYLTVAEFLCSEIGDELKNKCLFLDGLDEIRASNSSQSLLPAIKSKLIKLGRPSFRIACRAADWYGQSDGQKLSDASPNGQLQIYILEPLTQQGVRRILEENLQRNDAEDFITQAEENGISSLLTNPQTLALIAKALKSVTWPKSRDEVYRLACESLVQEENREHRDQARALAQPAPPKEDLLNTAGQLFAALLLADKSGVALDASAQNERFSQPADFGVPEVQSLGSLLVPSPSHHERLEPTHRSIAEYLAARWLGQQIDARQILLERVLKFVVGFDGKAIANLRGLYGWLALKSLSARSRLIENDPLTVVLYGDPRLMGVEANRGLLRAIQSQISANPSVIRSVFQNIRETEKLSSLFQTELRNQYLEALQQPQRDESTQTYVLFILKVLKSAANQAQLAEELRAIVSDNTRWDGIRRNALELWLESGISDNQAIVVLDGLKRGEISTSDETFIGILLIKLFPKALSALQALNYLHLPKSTIYGGWYQNFWNNHFPKTVSDNELIAVLDHLALRSDLHRLNKREAHTSSMLAALLRRGVLIHGDQISDSKLFTWLNLGTDEYGSWRVEPECYTAIAQWLGDRPERYKSLVNFCFERHQTALPPHGGLWRDLDILLCAKTTPADMGLWHFQNIDHAPNQDLAKVHLGRAIHSLCFDSSSDGLTLDMLFEWADDNPIKNKWLEDYLICDIPEEHVNLNQSTQKNQRQQLRNKTQRTIYLAANILEIRSGNSAPGLMYELAHVWLNDFSEFPGQDPLERFKSYCDNSREVFEATKAGMMACIKRNDLPAIEETIELSLAQHVHLIQIACLLGMDLIWTNAPDEIGLLDNHTLEKMVCFQLTGDIGEPEWFLHLVKNRPELVSNILTRYAVASFKAQKEDVRGISSLARDKAYAQLARLCVPDLIRNFPNRSKANQLNQLYDLLESALRYQMLELSSVVAEKLKLKSLNPHQRACFLFTGVLIDPEKYEKRLWDFIDSSLQPAQPISQFLNTRLTESLIEFIVSAKTLGKLIELQTPFAEINWPTGVYSVSHSMRLGDHVKALIDKLATLGTKEGLEEIRRLLTLPSLIKIKQHLLNSQNDALQRLRESEFSQPALSGVVKILKHESPTGSSDLQTIVLDCLDHIKTDIRISNADLFRQFWTETKENKHKTEPSCRDALLQMLRDKLEPLGINSEPEADYVADNRADIRVSYQPWSVPIEVKGEWHGELWTAIQSQLQKKYTGPDGYGIYLVLWVGGSEQLPPRDGGKKPTSAEELELRLQASISAELSQQISIRVIDITYPQ